MKIQAIVTDIEGTTTSIDFVHLVLFPYSMKALLPFLETNWDRADIKSIVQEICILEGLAEPSILSITEVLSSWMKADKKVTPLKNLQGLIWEDGYKQGLLRGHIYEDAAKELMRWHKAGIKLYIYSSGSVYAQKLLFGCSEFGDLTPLFSGYFDTTSGSKRESSSYQSISEAISLPPESILFLSDIVEELIAANEVGFKIVQLAREPSVSSTMLSPVGLWPVVKSFEQITL